MEELIFGFKDLPLNYLITGIAVGIGFISVALLSLFITLFSKTLTKRRLINKIGTHQSRLNNTKLANTYSSWVNEFDERMKKVGIRGISGKQYVLLIIAATIISALIGAFVFRNIVIVTFVGVMIIVYLEYVIAFVEKKNKELKMSQLVTAIRIFASEFSKTPQIEQGIKAVAEECPAPLGQVFKRAYNGFITNTPRDKIFEDMSKELNFEQGQKFIQLLESAQSNSTILPLFHELVTKITDEERMAQENKRQIFMEKLQGAILVVSPLLAYFVVQKPAPNAYLYLTGTVPGKIVIMLSLLSAIVFIILVRFTDDVENL